MRLRYYRDDDTDFCPVSPTASPIDVCDAGPDHERRRIVREQLTDVIGKAEDRLLIEQPPISELANISQNFMEQNDSLSHINGEVENIVDIVNLQAEMEDADDFDATVIVTKVKLQMKISDATNVRHALLTSMKNKIGQSLNIEKMKESVKFHITKERSLVQ